jgi:hypothetical protein
MVINAILVTRANTTDLSMSNRCELSVLVGSDEAGLRRHQRLRIRPAGRHLHHVPRGPDALRRGEGQRYGPGGVRSAMDDYTELRIMVLTGLEL